MHQKCLHISRSYVVQIPHFAMATMPPNKKAHPVEVSLLSAEAIVKVTNPLPQLVNKPFGAQNRRAGFHGFFVSVFLHSTSPTNPGCKPLSGGNRDQNIPHRPFYPAGSAGYITFCPRKDALGAVTTFNTAN